MAWIAYLVATVFALLGAACVLALVVQVPGTWMLLGLALLVEWLDALYLPAETHQTFAWWNLGACLALALLGELFEFLGSALGAKRGGASRRGLWGALIGGIAGVFVFTPLFFFVPLVGAFCGSLLGTFVGALVGELGDPARAKAGAGRSAALRPALWATLGRVLGTVGKLAAGIAMWLSLTVDAFLT